MPNMLNIETYFCVEDDMSSLEKYLSLAENKHFKQGEPILRVGMPVGSLYYLKNGSAGRLIVSESGVEKYIKVVRSQSLIGEVVFFLGASTIDQFIAIEDCDTYLFEKDVIYSIMQKDSEVLNSFVRWFCNRMMSLNSQVLDSFVKDPRQRVYTFLLDYVRLFGKMDTKECLVYEGKLSHYDIAKFLGMNRVSVTRALNDLQEENLIFKDRHRLIIKNAKNARISYN